MEKETGLKKVRFDPYTKNKHSMGYTDNNIILHTVCSFCKKRMMSFWQPFGDG
jgi:hypothetical protein